jgi:predicted tellurium resistance membrane protein TerC
MATESLIALLALTGMEIILGIDNIIFIAVITGRLPPEQQAFGRRLGLGAALVTRVLLLLLLKVILGLTAHLFSLTSCGIPAAWLTEEMNHVSIRDLILLAGGLFLIAKSVYEIHESHHEATHGDVAPKTKRFSVVILEIAVLDIVFSLDSVITAVGMAEELSIMVAAIVIAIIVMMIFARSVSEFVQANPTIKTLALSFLILIGIMLVAEAVGQEIDKGYIYFAMAFALAVEVLNMRMRKPAQRLHESSD